MGIGEAVVAQGRGKKKVGATIGLVVVGTQAALRPRELAELLLCLSSSGNMPRDGGVGWVDILAFKRII